jgi:hypothetical protein
LVNFLLLIEDLTNYSKKEIDEGETPLDIYKLCNCIRETFCISYSIRKNNNLFFYFHEEQVIIKFVGNELKYLGSDERSQALLLMKAIDKKTSLNQNDYDRWIKSTPGIFFRKFYNDSSLIEYLDSMKEDFILIINEYNLKNNSIFPEIKKFKDLENVADYFYIIPTYPISENLIQLIKGLKNIQFIELLKIKTIQDKILYINYRNDKFQGL